MLERAVLEPWQARPRGYSRQKGRFIQGINQLKAAGWEKVVCLAARAALSFTTARRAHSLIYGRLQVIKEVSRRNDNYSLSLDKFLWILSCTFYLLLENMTEMQERSNKGK